MRLKLPPLSRVAGLGLIVLAIIMFLKNQTYTTKFDTFSQGGREHHEFTFDYLKVLVIGLVIFLFKEFMRYVYHREY
jgi:hypothetical protein